MTPELRPSLLPRQFALQVEPALERLQRVQEFGGDVYELHSVGCIIEAVCWIEIGRNVGLHDTLACQRVMQYLMTKLSGRHESFLDNWSSEFFSGVRGMLSTAGKRDFTVDARTGEAWSLQYESLMHLNARWAADELASFTSATITFVPDDEWQSILRFPVHASAVQDMLVQGRVQKLNDEWPLLDAAVAGLIRTFEWMGATLELLSRIPIKSKIRAELYSVRSTAFATHRWRLNLHNNETRRRFDQLAQRTIDLLASALRDGDHAEAVDASLARVKALAQEWIDADTGFPRAASRGL